LKKRDGLLRQGNKVKYVFVAQHKKTWPVDLMCQLFGITRSGYYGYQRRGGGGMDYYHKELLEAVEDIAEATDDNYGSRRIKQALNALGYPVSRRNAGKLMKEAGVQVKHRKKYKVTTNSDHKQPVFDSVSDRKFEAGASPLAALPGEARSVTGVVELHIHVLQPLSAAGYH
jgi:putative transposase